MIRVLLADSHQLLYLGIRTTLSTTSEMMLIEAVTCASHLRQFCRQHRPDVVLLALNLTDSSGTEVINDIQQQCPAAETLLMLNSPDEVCLHPLMEVGVTGVMCKSDAPEKLLEAIQTVAAGHPWFSPPLMSQLLKSHNGQGNSNKLTEREITVLQLVAAEKTDKEIALELNIKKRTVRYHLENINLKLGTKTRVGAAIEAVKCGLI